MKKQFLLLLVLVAGLLPVKAQNAMLTEINKIKSSPNYIYGESTQASREDALNAAFDDMMHQVDQWAAKETHDKDVEMSNDDVREMVKTIETKRGSMTRMVVYVRRAQLAELLREAGYKINFKEQAEEEATAQPAPAPAPARNTSAPVVEVVEEELPSSTVQGGESGTTSTNVPDVSVVSIEGLSDDEILEVYLTNGSQMTPEQEAEVERAASRIAERDNVERKMGTPIQQIMAVRSFYELKSVMVPLKLNGYITKMGKYRTMTEPEISYLVIYDTNANIRAVLGPGTKTRKNLRTDRDDSIYNYGGCGAIWFQLSNKN